MRQFAVRMNEKAKCNFCERLISCKDGNTSNISNHILNVHGDLKDVEKFRAMQKEKKNKLKLKRLDKEKKSCVCLSNPHY